MVCEPNDLLSRLIGDRLVAVTFVLNDYLQLQFDEASMNVDVWPHVRFKGGRGMRRTSDTGMPFARSVEPRWPHLRSRGSRVSPRDALGAGRAQGLEASASGRYRDRDARRKSQRRADVPSSESWI